MSELSVRGLEEKSKCSKKYTFFLTGSLKLEDKLFTILQLSLFETLYVTGSLILVGIVLGIIENRANFYTQRILGIKGVLATAWIGTPIHELGHLLMCYLFRHKVGKSKLLDLKAADGVLGYVNHEWDRKSLYQSIGNFFIGMGPIFSGTSALILGMYIFLPDSSATFANYLTFNPGTSEPYLFTKILILTVELFKSIFSVENLNSARFWIYFALAIGISSHIALSREDLKGAGRGLVTIFTLILLVNAAALILNIDISGFFRGILILNIYLLAFPIVSIVFSLIRLILSASAYFLVKIVP